MATVHANLEHITPDRAAELLARNTHNRPISRPYVREIMRELEEGRWKVTHQGVALSDDGQLLDGQHRLTAIVESGIAADMLVAEGVVRDAFDAIDQHRKRTGGQILAMAGITKDAPRIVAMARAVLTVVHGVNKASNTAASEYAVGHQAVLERYLPLARQFTPAVGAAFAWCDSLGWPEVARAAERLASNGPWEEPQDTDPMRALANRAREFSKLGQGQAGIKARFDVALNCLQALHEGRGLRVARTYKPDYAALERDALDARERLLHPETLIEVSEFDAPPPELTDEHAERLEASLGSNKRRKSFLSPEEILAKMSK